MNYLFCVRLHDPARDVDVRYWYVTPAQTKERLIEAAQVITRAQSDAAELHLIFQGIDYEETATFVPVEPDQTWKQ